MSTLRVNNMTNVGGTGPTYAPGHIVQTLSTFKADAFTTASTTFVDITGLSISITPKFSTSKILVLVEGVVGQSVATNSLRVNLIRDSTNISQGTGGSVNQTKWLYPNNVNTVVPIAINFLDSPATTSAITYKVQISAEGGGTACWGRRGSLGDYSCSSSITVMEVAA